MKVRCRCPYCGAERSTKVCKKILCFRCGRRYSVFGNIKYIIEGDEWELHRLYYKIHKKDILRKKKL